MPDAVHPNGALLQMFVQHLRGSRHFLDYAEAFCGLTGMDVTIEEGISSGVQRDVSGRRWQTIQVFLESEPAGYLRMGPFRLRRDPTDPRTPVLTRPRLAACTRLLEAFARFTSEGSNRFIAAWDWSPSPVVSRARRYIAEHYQEDLTLSVLAKACFSSPSHLCRLFVQSTAVGFTEYLQRVRIEAVKRRLLDPSQRISEAAFASGFQSLSQFNRVFQRVLGCPPRHWRATHAPWREENHSSVGEQSAPCKSPESTPLPSRVGGVDGRESHPPREQVQWRRALGSM